MTITKTHTLLWKAIQAAVPAGNAILKVYETDFEVEKKSDESPLTRADLEAHTIISSMLESTGIPILSEEGRDIQYTERSSWTSFWMVDPLDGTKEFVNRNGEFTVNIALISKDFPVAGVIYIPVTDELYFGIHDEGSFKLSMVRSRLQDSSSIEELKKVSTPLPMENDRELFTVVCSRSHMSAETEEFIDKLKSKHGDVEYASRGSSLKLCMVAEGKADIYPRFAPTMEWDTAAGQAIAESAGVSVIQAENGNRLRYNKEDLLNPWFIVERK
jgi:3'(2'), 5'-bisphosphate nucleotidase